MARKKKQYDDDDGRTIVDMSQVSHPSPLGSWSPSARSRRREEPAAPEEGREERPWEDNSMSREERRMYVLGAMKAALLIALAFIVGIGLVIALLLWLWL